MFTRRRVLKIKPDAFNIHPSVDPIRSTSQEDRRTFTCHSHTTPSYSYSTKTRPQKHDHNDPPVRCFALRGAGSRNSIRRKKKKPHRLDNLPPFIDNRSTATGVYHFRSRYKSGRQVGLALLHLPPCPDSPTLAPQCVISPPPSLYAAL